MSLKRFKECRTCGKQEPRGWTEASIYQCEDCKAALRASLREVITAPQLTDEQRRQNARMNELIQTMANRPQAKVVQAPRSMADKSAAREANALRSDPTRRALHRSGDDLDPLNPLSLTSPLNPIYHADDWDSSSHRNHSSSASSSHDDDSSRHTSHHSSHDSGSYDSGSSDSGSSSSGGWD